MCIRIYIYIIIIIIHTLQQILRVWRQPVPTAQNIYIYCILRGQIKGFNSSITTIMFEVGSYGTVVG